MSAPRQRQLYENGAKFDLGISSNEQDEPIEHRPARRREGGPFSVPRVAMFFAAAFGSICLVYLWIWGGEAARFGWEREEMWKPQWYAHMATW